MALRLRDLSLVFVTLGLAATASQCATAVPVDDSTPVPTSTTGRDGGPTPGKDGGCVTQCAGKCTDTLNDTNNCGKCSNACPPNSACNAGACVCNQGKLCGGKCADTQTDVTNCGTCGNDCTTQGDAGTWSCVAGTCTLGCSNGQIPCNGACFDPQTTDNHCGTCGNDCTASSQSCCSGSCADTTSDAKNCGSCGNACNGSQCTNSSCCTLEPTGSCDQNPCTQGNPLTPGCDGTGCVNKVCSNDPFCCDLFGGFWDGTCVSEVDQFCGPQYKCKC